MNPADQPHDELLAGVSEAPKVGLDDLVRYKEWTGRVYEVLSDGSVLIDWTGSNPPFRHPWFHGPYRSDELERVDAR